MPKEWIFYKKYSNLTWSTYNYDLHVLNMMKLNVFPSSFVIIYIEAKYLDI
jgi:hypothetical protein